MSNQDLLNIVNQAQNKANTSGVIETEYIIVQDATTFEAERKSVKRKMFGWGIMTVLFWAFLIPIPIFIYYVNRYVKMSYGSFKGFRQALGWKGNILSAIATIPLTLLAIIIFGGFGEIFGTITALAGLAVFVGFIVAAVRNKKGGNN